MYWSISSKNEHPSTFLHFKNKATSSCITTIYMCVERQRYTFMNLNLTEHNYFRHSYNTIYPSEVGQCHAELVNIQFFRPNVCIHQHLLKQEYGFTIKLYLPPPPPNHPLLALAAVCSKGVVLLLLIHCLLLRHCLWGFCVLCVLLVLQSA